MCGRGRARPLCLWMESVWLRLDARKWKPFGGRRNGDISESTPAVRSNCLHCVRANDGACQHGFWPRSADRREGPRWQKILLGQGGWTIYAADGHYTNSKGATHWSVPEPGVVEIGYGRRQFEVLTDGRIHNYRFCGACQYHDKICGGRCAIEQQPIISPASRSDR